jgi:aspartyl-tRNA(Asn)/glutamyl-tRNA(Gln) amidotransferase subunit A
VELAQESLHRIHEEQRRLNAFITITGDLALAQARHVDEELARGIDRGPLHGIPYALKDLFETRGIRTTSGSKIFADYIPDRDCAVYRSLTAAGAVLMGKTGMHELAYGVTNDNPHFGAVRNPRDPDRISGGSSGGSAAAVAANLVFFAMGTDTGGSIRIPAAYCGCVGFKPTFGTLSREGVLPLSCSMDHVGPLTRTVRDAALVMEMAPTPDDLIAGQRIGVPQNFFTEGLAPAAESAFEETLHTVEKLGAKLVPITVPDPAAINVVARIILLSEASAFLQTYINRRSDFGADVLALLDQGRLVSATDYINAQRLRHLYQSRWNSVWEEVDFLFTPTVAFEAPLISEQQDLRLASTRLVRPFNALGLPAISIPMGTGLQIVSKTARDQVLLALASAIFPQSS